MKDLIAERTGVQPGTMGGFFKLNPRVDDLPDELSVPVDGVRLMVMGTVKEGAGRLRLPGIDPAALRLSDICCVRRDEAVILDMEAGIEHLGRGTASGVDAMLVVVEPGARSARTADGDPQAGHRHRHQAAVRGAEQGGAGRARGRCWPCWRATT